MTRKTRGVLRFRSLTATTIVAGLPIMGVACVPDPGTGGTTTTTTTTTTTAAPLDSDGDGIPDTADPCPAYADPGGYCPTTPYDINNGTVSPGFLAVVTDLVVIDVGGTTPVGHAELSPLSPAYSGPTGATVTLDLSSVTAPDVGTHITVRGTVNAVPGLHVTAFTVTG